ncbi:HAMP domain-containing sensor histidine kinase [Nonomuraea sp. NPDC050310]|uniref:sensor histidine kinase n=1 Tax=Nonomuraea sp. NPDC050310 TaxID=3154935 RepID=UPI0033C92340
MRHGSLRSRLTLLVTAAVAIAIAAVAAVSGWLVYRELDEGLDRSLGNVRPNPAEVRTVGRNCQQNPKPQPVGGHWFGPVWQVVTDTGERCLPHEQSLAIKVEPADIAVTKLPAEEALVREGQLTNGKRVRVMTTSLGNDGALMAALPEHDIYGAMGTLVKSLVLVALVGVLGAATIGLLIANTALRPVRRLTKAVEHIAQTEDLDTTIPVKGDDEIARLSRSFNAMTAALAGSRDRQRQLVADAGHELRTPLTSLRTNIDLLLRSEQTGRALDPAAKERLLVNVKAQFAELSTLVGDLLMLSRGETDREPHTRFAFHEVVAAAIERAELRGAEVRSDLEPWYVLGNPASLERAVLNLLDNAAKFSPGEIDVQLEAGVLTVRDHGPGIPDQDMPHVFERFWRSSSARSLPGSGLGLAIVMQAVKEAGGSVELENAPDGGVLATISLPGLSSSQPPHA